jgi:hypothetical protein
MKILQFVALGAERNSAMRRADLADLTAFVAVADNLSFRAAAPPGLCAVPCWDKS